MLEKLTIKAFKDETFGSQVGEDFVVQINPEKHKLENPINFTEKRATEGAGVTTKFVVLDPRTLDFTLYFDDTGAVPPGKKGASTDIKTQIDAFKEVAFNYNGEIHKPNYLKVIWGTFEFKCHLTKFTLNYTLFKPDCTLSYYSQLEVPLPHNQSGMRRSFAPTLTLPLSQSCNVHFGIL